MNRYYLSDEQWDLCHAFLKAHPRVYVGNPERCRLFLNAVLWILRSGSQWRSLPVSYGCWNSVFKRYDRWVAANVWGDLFEAVSLEADLQEGFIDGKMKHYRRVFSRFEKKAVNFLGFLKITAMLIWTR